MENRLSKALFSGLVPKKKRSGGESQKSVLGFDLKSPSRVWILWIHDPFLDSTKRNLIPPKRRKIWIVFSNQGLDFLKKAHPIFRLASFL